MGRRHPRVLGDRDVGPQKGVQGQEKLWRTHWVDAELRDEWLERLNSIPGIEVVSTCAGHCGIIRNQYPGGPEVIVKTVEPELFIREFSRVLADKEPWLEQRVDSFEGPIIEAVILKDRFLGIFGPKTYPYFFVADKLDRKEPSIRIMADKHRDHMSDASFVEWWETLLGTLETMSRA